MLLLLLLGCLLPLSAQRHRDITFDAKLTKSRVLLNSTLEYSVTLRNSRGDDFRPPSFPGFLVLNGPGRTMGSNTVNGSTTTYQSYTWLLQATRAGTLTIGPASIRAGGRTYRTNSVTVEVFPPNEKLAANAPDNYLELRLSTDTAYVGQQVILDLVLFTTDNAISRNLVAEPALDDFFSYPRRQYDGRPRNVLENGKEYVAQTVASVATYPLKSGTLTIEPYRVLLGLVRYRNPRSTFSRRYTERIPIQTDTTTLFVRDMPPPVPNDFSGGVGSFRLESNLDRDTLSTDDALTLRLTITGKGDVKRINVPEPVDPTEWVIYDPKKLKEEFYDSPSGIFGQKILEYKLVPKRAGEKRLRPTLRYFDPDSSRYVRLSDLDYRVLVTQGSVVGNYDEPEVADSTPVLQLIPAGPVRKVRRYGTGWLDWGSGLALGLLPVLALFGLFFVDRSRRRAASLDPREKARRAARKLADSRLAKARQALRNRDAPATYAAIQDALLGYLRDKLNVPVKELSKHRIGDLLSQKEVPDATVNDFIGVLNRCELALYGATADAEEAQRAYAAAERCLLALEGLE